MTVVRVVHTWVFRRSTAAVLWCLLAGVVGLTAAPAIHEWVAYYPSVRIASPGDDCSPSTSTLVLDRTTGEALICQVDDRPKRWVVGEPEPAPDFPYPAEKDRLLGMAISLAADGGLDEADEAELHRYEESVQYRHGRTDIVPNTVRAVSVLPLALALLALPAVARPLWLHRAALRRAGTRATGAP